MGVLACARLVQEWCAWPHAPAPKFASVRCHFQLKAGRHATSSIVEGTAFAVIVLK